MSRHLFKPTYTPEENDFIAQNYHRMTAAQLAKALRRPIKSIQKHILRELDLSKNHRRKYPDVESLLITDIKEFEEIFHRPPDQKEIETFAEMRGLPKSPCRARRLLSLAQVGR